MTDIQETRPELSAPNQAMEIVEYVASNVHSALDDVDPDVRSCAQLVMDAIKDDAEHGLLVGLTPEFVDETTDDSADIPISTFVRVFADGHYPIASPSSEGRFYHDVHDHFRAYRKLGRDKGLSEHVQAQAQVLMDELEQSNLNLNDPANTELRNRFEAFGDNMDLYTASILRYNKLSTIYA